jgi:aminoglycoside phosphotransferase (APT) family kinase protein
LQRVRALGFELPPYRVVEPLAVNEALEFLLVEEYVAGPKLDAFIRGAIKEGQGAALCNRLTDLAAFLGTLHQRSETDQRVQPADALGYLNKMSRQLHDQQVLDDEAWVRLEHICERWASESALARAPQVLLHGDTTPVNFVFRGEHEVIAIDLERSDFGDGMVDVGSIEAELRHAFLSATGDAEASTPYIEHFHGAYAMARQPRAEDAASMDERGRFWRGVYALRISRNDWLDMAYRRRLVQEALLWLSS